jgi:hypothetical protein
LIGLFYLPFIVGFCIPVIFERQTWVEIRQWLNQRFEQQKKALWGIFIYQVVSKIEERKRRLE